MIARIVNRIDSIQRNNQILGFILAVFAKLSQDRVSSLAALFAYFALFAILPLLLALISVLGIALARNPALQGNIVNSALANFPIIGPQIRSNIHSISGNVVQLTLALVGVALSTRGLSGISIRSLNQLWYIPNSEQPSFVSTLLRSFSWTLVVGIGATASTALAGLASHNPLISLVGVLGINIGFFLTATRICLPRRITFKQFYRGAVAGAVAWELLLFFGSDIVRHQLAHSSALYGFFGIILGLLTWVYSIAFSTLLFAAADVVWCFKLWPRALDKKNPTSADIVAQNLILKSQMNPAITVK